MDRVHKLFLVAMGYLSLGLTVAAGVMGGWFGGVGLIWPVEWVVTGLVFVAFFPGLVYFSVPVFPAIIINALVFGVGFFARDSIPLSWNLVVFSFGIGFGVASFLKMIFSSEEKDFLRDAFGHFVSPEVLKQLLNSSKKLALQGESLEITVVFFDIKGFTKFATTHNPVVVVNRLNHALGIVSQEVLKNHGMVNKFVGDSVVAMWGAPTTDPKQGQRALLTALKVRERIQTETNFEIVTSINSGMAIVGDFGPAKRFEYTAVGPTVSLAWRLGVVAGELNESIVMTDDAKKRLNEEKVDVQKLRDMGKLTLMARGEPVHWYAV